MICGACGQEAPVFRVVDGYPFADCPHCGSLAVDASVVARVDRGEFDRHYDDDYWNRELSAARERAAGSSLALVAEAILYADRPIEAFIDLGAGPGFLLDMLAMHLPASKVFHGVERFPPETRTALPNYHVGDLMDVDLTWDAGVCIEVLEHLTPTMVSGLADALAAKSNDRAFYMVCTGSPEFVKNEDPGYLDPLGRGHIMSWGLGALRSIFEPRGFAVIPMRSWAFALEYRRASDTPPAHRIWTSPNAHLLRDERLGDVMYLLGRETARVYG